ncbi:MAG: hypothetical protein V3R98_11390 [Alphaproteobacteria bacterium]
MFQTLKSFWQDETGSILTEYGLLLPILGACALLLLGHVAVILVVLQQRVSERAKLNALLKQRGWN